MVQLLIFFRFQDGYLYGRGTLDDKSALMAILEALKEILTLDKLLCSREFFVALTHDEEVSGTLGAIKVAARLKEILNGKSLDFVLDEGSIILEDFQDGFPPLGVIGIAEKGALDIKLTSITTGGHSSSPPKTTAITKISDAILKLNELEFPQYLNDTALAETLYELAPYYPSPIKDLINDLNASKVSEQKLINLFSRDEIVSSQMQTVKVCTLISGGIAHNVVPSHCSANINCRLHPRDTGQSIINRTKAVVGDDIKVEISEQSDSPPTSSVDTEAYRNIVADIKKTFPTEVRAFFTELKTIVETNFVLKIEEKQPLRICIKVLIKFVLIFVQLLFQKCQFSFLLFVKKLYERKRVKSSLKR